MNYGDYLSRAARLFGASVAIIDGERAVTYAEWEERARRLAVGLRATGLQKDDRVADIGWNRLESLEIDFGVSMAHLTRVSIDADLPLDTMAMMIDDSGCRALIVGPGLEETGKRLLGRCPGLEILVGPDATGHCAYEELMAHGDELRWNPPGEDDILALRYTGGTTGHPKAVIRRHGEQIHVAGGILLDLYPITSDERMLHATPLSHGANPYVLPLAMRGASQVILRRFDAVEALRLVAEHNVTSTKIVPPTMVVRLTQARRGPCADLDITSLRRIIYGSAPMPSAVLRKAADVFGPIFVETFGLTEFPVGIACLPLRSHREGLVRNAQFLNSAGRPYSLTDVAIRLADGTTVGASDGAGLIGEVIVRGPMMMSGYWNRPAATRSAIRNGWLYTGDVGRFDEDGFLYLLGRQQDAIKKDDETVFPREVEEVLYRHPDVSDALVVELEDRQLAAMVVPMAGANVTRDDLIAHCLDHLPSAKCPAVITFVNDVPQTPTGKVLRRAARDQIAKQISGRP